MVAVKDCSLRLQTSIEYPPGWRRAPGITGPMLVASSSEHVDSPKSQCGETPPGHHTWPTLYSLIAITTTSRSSRQGVRGTRAVPTATGTESPISKQNAFHDGRPATLTMPRNLRVRLNERDHTPPARCGVPVRSNKTDSNTAGYRIGLNNRYYAVKQRDSPVLQCRSAPCCPTRGVGARCRTIGRRRLCGAALHQR
jgi:hypothetical protein